MYAIHVTSHLYAMQCNSSPAHRHAHMDLRDADKRHAPDPKKQPIPDMHTHTHTCTSGVPTGNTYLTRDEQGNLLTTEYGLCEYTDSQGLHLQEAPENSEVGQLPRAVDIMVTNDLVDKVKPGDRVQVVGVYKPLAGGNETSGMFRTVIIGVSVKRYLLSVHHLMSYEMVSMSYEMVSMSYEIVSMS